MIPTLTRPQRQVFTVAYACPGLNLNELARATGLNPATISRSVRALEGHGLLQSTVRAAVTNIPRRHRRLCRLVSPAAWTVAGGGV